MLKFMVAYDIKAWFKFLTPQAEFRDGTGVCYVRDSVKLSWKSTAVNIRTACFFTLRSFEQGHNEVQKYLFFSVKPLRLWRDSLLPYSATYTLVACILIILIGKPTCESGSSVRIVSRLWAGFLENRDSIPNKSWGFSAIVPRQFLGSRQFPFQCEPAEKRSRLTTRIYIQ
jgi:hypothetical protein